jgi:hypothetical protein
MTTTILFKSTELMLRNSMKFFRNNTNRRKKRLMSNSRESSRLKKS